jgi:3-deoxy-7-phosphoheptulonate synthase
MELISPAILKQQFPLRAKQFVQNARAACRDILQRKDPRLAVIMGPCSIHDPNAAFEYAQRLKTLSNEIDDQFMLIMRVFIEKPRTCLGWKGYLYDPLLNGSYDIESGIRRSRELMLEITDLGVPIATEFLNPILSPFFDDLVSWGLIGARTSASQPHRQMASNFPFPVGFKNDCQGRIDEAIAAIIYSQNRHQYVAINEHGSLAKISSSGNKDSHLVLRGSVSASNYDSRSIQEALDQLTSQNIHTGLLIDCSHGNCGKNHERQAAVFTSVIKQAKTNNSIAGLMLESHLFEGKQALGETLQYGVSITDPCIGWEETETLLLSTSMRSVQN